MNKMIRNTLTKIKGFVINLSHKRLFTKISLTTIISICMAYLVVWVVFLIPHLIVVAQAWQYLMVDYVKIEEVDTNTLFNKALQGLQSSLLNSSVSVSQGIIDSILESIDDPYTRYLTPQRYGTAMDHISGSFEGIGVWIAVDGDENLVIIAPIPGSPAEAAGILPGDRILEIDDQDTAGMTTLEASGLMRGKVNTEVTLSILHEDGSGPELITVARAEVDIPSVTAEEIETNIVYVKLYSFTSNSGDEFIDVIQSFIDTETIGIIVDIRDNPGGVVSDCVQISSQFLNEGDPVLHETDGKFNPLSTYTAEASELQIGSDVRVAVLQNNGSASASEIFAGALQDSRDNAAIIGTNSFGKGSVNHILELVDGSALIVTFAYWTTPDERYIGETKITPDIVVEDENAQLDIALDYVKDLL